MLFERYFLTTEGSAVKAPASPETRIVGIAYPLADNVYCLHQKPVSEVIITPDQLFLTAPQGSKRIALQSNKPVFVWCRGRDGSTGIECSKIYSVVQDETRFRNPSPA